MDTRKLDLKFLNFVLLIIYLGKVYKSVTVLLLVFFRMVLNGQLNVS